MHSAQKNIATHTDMAQKVLTLSPNSQSSKGHGEETKILSCARFISSLQRVDFWCFDEAAPTKQHSFVILKGKSLP